MLVILKSVPLLIHNMAAKWTYEVDKLCLIPLILQPSSKEYAEVGWDMLLFNRDSDAAGQVLPNSSTVKVVT
jgi:hypothetical protein